METDMMLTDTCVNC